MCDECPNEAAVRANHGSSRPLVEYAERRPDKSPAEQAREREYAEVAKKNEGNAIPLMQAAMAREDALIRRLQAAECASRQARESEVSAKAYYDALSKVMTERETVREQELQNALASLNEATPRIKELERILNGTAHEADIKAAECDLLKAKVVELERKASESSEAFMALDKKFYEATEQNKNLTFERDQLKAEVERLKDCYAAERERDQLKAENGTLTAANQQLQDELKHTPEPEWSLEGRAYTRLQTALSNTGTPAHEVKAALEVFAGVLELKKAGVK